MYQRQMSMRIGGPLTPVVKQLLIINVVVFVIQFISPDFMSTWFGLSHQGLILEFKIWQIFSYMFLHSTGYFIHIIFNMLLLWMLGGELEQKWGSKYFLKFYLLSGVGAGVFIALMNAFMVSQYPLSYPAYATTIGASGAIYGILLAYGMLWPNREVLVYFLFPVKMKYLVLFFVSLSFFGTLMSATGTGGNISHIGHLGGLVTAYLLLTYKRSGRKAKGYTSVKRKFSQGIFSEMLKKQRLKQKQEEIDKRIKSKKIIDRLLEKIAREGMSSLSSKEKRDLEWARKNYYPGNNETLH